MKGKDLIKQASRWYFNKRVSPSWYVVLMDMLIVFISCAFAYWVSNRTGRIYENRFAVVYTSLLYAVLSLGGAAVFKTYSGVVRYSSFIDLLKVAYANLLTLGLCEISLLVLNKLEIYALTALSPLEIVVAIAIADYQYSK